MKRNRQNEIISLINKKQIETQEELSEELRALGFIVTQATVSRDIRELGLVKVAGAGGKYCYTVPIRDEKNINSKAMSLLIGTVENIDRAGNITVVKTYAGMAQGAAAAIDSMGRPDIVGSVAGDDTIIIVMRTNEAAQSLCEDIQAIVDGKI